MFSHYIVSYRWSVWTNRVSCTVVEIWSLKDFGVITLTFWGHVTSSVTWPLDSQYMVVYVLLKATRRYLAWLLRYFQSTVQPSIFPLKIHWSPFWCFRVKWGMFFQLWAHSDPRDASREPLTATIGHCYCSVRTFPLNMHYGVKNWGKIAEGIIGFWPLPKTFLLFGPKQRRKISSKWNKIAAVYRSDDRQTDRMTQVIV